MEAKIKLVIFDMDGLMVNSEPTWNAVMKTVFENLGLALTDDMCLECMGLRTDEAIKHLLSKYSLETEKSVQDIENLIITKMVLRLKSCKDIAMPGLYSALDFFKSKGVKLAVASSSPKEIIEAALVGLDILSFFDLTCSATEERYGKPHPAVYITTANKLKVPVTECLALEDSLNGAISAKAARMKVIAVPDKQFCVEESKFHFTDSVLDSLEDINDALWNKLNFRRS